MSVMKSLLWVALALGGGVLVGCGPRSANCESWQIERNGMCFGNCNTVAPPCFAEDGGLVFPEAGTTDGGSMDGAADAGVCSAGATLCSGQCVNTQSDTSHCGACGRSCMAGAGERAACVASQCSAECVSGFERVGMSACDAPVLRLLGPMSTSYVSSQRPTLRWAGVAGLDGAVVEVCSSRDCAMVVQRGVVSGGATSWRVERALSAGVYFWRVRGRSGMSEGARNSAVWQFVVGARDRATDTNWGTMMDVNGDGFGDVVVGHEVNTTGWSGDWFGHWGRTAGVEMMPSWMLRDPQAAAGATAAGIASVASAGDINGDGFGDVLLGAAQGRNAMMVATGSVTVVFGSAMGLRDPQQLFGAADGDAFGAAVSAAGDVNGDGYGDVVVGAPQASAPAAAAGRAYVFFGGPTGLQSSPALVLSGTRSMGHFGAALTGAHDVNGDGRPDLVVAAPDMDDPLEGESAVGWVAYFEGAAGGLPMLPTRTWTRVERAGEVAGGYRLGVSVARPGDVNGDGFGDLVFGADDDRVKRDVLVVRGAMSGASMVFDRVSPVSPEARRVGASVDLGDANGDGFDDLVFANNSTTSSGLVAQLVAGASGAGGMTQSIGTPGRSVAVLPDLNGDGLRELAGIRPGNPGGLTVATVQISAGSRSAEWDIDWTVVGGMIR